jgi:protein-L-isoaspartate(D-aspartate) O-methyltransferase
MSKFSGGDGGEKDPGPCDAVLVNAGATHPRSIWLDSLRPDGTTAYSAHRHRPHHHGGEGRILKVTRQPEGLMASFISGVRIFPCVGGRDSELNQRLKEAFERDDWKSVQSLRRDKHESSDSCWLHGETFCLSKTALAP